MIAYLEHCRPKGIAGGNVIRWLKAEINRIGTDESVREESEVSDGATLLCMNYSRLMRDVARSKRSRSLKRLTTTFASG